MEGLHLTSTNPKPPPIPSIKQENLFKQANKELDTVPLGYPTAATNYPPIPPGTVRNFLNSINQRLDKLHPVAKYLIWGVLGAATAAALVCALIYATGSEGAVKKWFSGFLDVKNGWTPIINSMKVGALGAGTFGVVASRDTYRPGELSELGKYAAISFGIFAAYGTGMGLAFGLRH